MYERKIEQRRRFSLPPDLDFLVSGGQTFIFSDAKRGVAFVLPPWAVNDRKDDLYFVMNTYEANATGNRVQIPRQIEAEQGFYSDNPIFIYDALHYAVISSKKITGELPLF